MHYLITGGCGYIGSHMAKLLHDNGYRVTIIDNFSNSGHASLQALQNACDNRIHFMQADVRDISRLQACIMTASLREPIDGVLHFAGLKSVDESVRKPINYYQSNVSGTLNLLEVMAKFRLKKLVFSSSATVYGSQKAQRTQH